MTIGKMDQIITLESLVETNDSGDLSLVWTGQGDEFAQVISQKGSEAFEAARTSATELIRVMLHYRSDIDSTWRLRWDTQYYNIVNVDSSQARSKGLLWLTAQLKDAA